MNIELIFAVLKEGLSLTNDIRAKSLPNKLAKLEKEWNEERAKGKHKWSDLTLDNIRAELCIIAEQFARIRDIQD